MKHFLLGATAVAALVASQSFAFATPPLGLQSATVPVMAKINGGPWTLAQTPATATTPYAGYCAGGAQTVSPGLEPMQPYYFPHIEKLGNYLQGWFDYRPRNAQEAVVAALSRDHGVTWQFQGKAAALNTACPALATDPNNVNISAGGGPIVANELTDNGQGHPFTMTVAGKRFLYTLDRSSANIDILNLIVHPITSTVQPLAGIAPVESAGYNQITGTLASEGLVAPVGGFARTTGLLNPDAILGVLPGANVGVTTILYASKILAGDNTGPTALPAAQQCKATPAWAVSPGRKANHDYVTQRIATTTDGINFTDQGLVSGLADQTTVSFHGIRYIGSGGVFPLANADGVTPNGRFGLLFGAGNCLDGDSDGFHFIGYAETTTAGNVMNWTVLNGLDNPIVSTGQVTDPSSGTVYPANTPLADLNDWPTQSATNFYYGRSYGATAGYVGPHTLTMVFAGYLTPQPKNNLGNYRSIGVSTITLPATTFALPF